MVSFSNCQAPGAQPSEVNVKASSPSSVTLPGDLVAVLHVEVTEGTVPKVAVQGKAGGLLIARPLYGINKASVHK